MHESIPMPDFTARFRAAIEQRQTKRAARVKLREILRIRRDAGLKIRHAAKLNRTQA